MRVWERGSGETFSCGTGACAAVVAARLKGLVDSSATVELLGGELTIEWKGIEFSVFMTGSSFFIFNGNITI
jgi:diaminopimelate epimerase